MTSTSPIRDTREELNPAAEMLLSEGAVRLLSGDLSGLDLFDRAAEASPDDATLLFRQGLSCFEYGCSENDVEMLLLASKKFKAACRLNWDAYQAWGSCLLELGNLTEENHYFKTAQEKFAHVKNSDDGEFYWELALVLSHLAHISGEGLELQQAVEAFEIASLLQADLPADFWLSYGAVCLKLARLVNDPTLAPRAVDIFRIALAKEVSSEVWHALAGGLKTLYEQTHDEDHFAEGSEAYAYAAALRPEASEIWHEWGSFLCEIGRKNRDSALLKLACEKCAHAHDYDRENPLILATWAEALAFVGMLSDNIELIFEAQNKLLEAEELEEESPEFWHSAGMVSLASGEYFEDLDDVYCAIEHFQAGLSLDRTSVKLWHAIAVAYTLVGIIEGELEDFEKARKFFLRALDLAPTTSILFDYGVCLSHLGEVIHSQEWLEEAKVQIERAISIQKNAFYAHPEWIAAYASTLDMLGDFHDEEAYYLKAIELYSHVLMIDPDFSGIHHRIALAFSHLGSLLEEQGYLERALHHFELAGAKEKENPILSADWGLSLMTLAERKLNGDEIEAVYAEAEQKFMMAAKFGYSAAYYHLACLYSLVGRHEQAISFLEKSDRFAALPPLEEILEDEWLEDVRSTYDFRSFLMRLEGRK
jgi:tetratricopeptide (TPR) repeat protein